MSTQKSYAEFKDKFKNIMLDDKHSRAADIAKYMKRRRKKEDYNPPTRLSSKYDVQTVVEGGNICFLVSKKGSRPDKMIFYIHGGGNCMQINKNQWEFVFSLVEDTNYVVAVPIYPLAPENCCYQSLEKLLALYSRVSKVRDIDRMVIIGEEAGGGLALSLAILAWKNGKRRPDKLILASPFLDSAYVDKDLQKIVRNSQKKNYHYFSTPEVEAFVRIFWIKGETRKEYVSPLTFDLTDVCDEVDIFVSADDMLKEHGIRLYTKLKNTQTRVNLFELYGVIHNYIEHPAIPECRGVYKKIVSSINNDGMVVSSDINQAVWARMFLAERYTSLYSDPTSIKLATKMELDYKAIQKKFGDYDKLVALGRILAIDDQVRHFIYRYPDGVVVNLGSELDTMFERMDNTRIKWYNVDLPDRIELRKKLLGTRDREINIERSIFDYTWIDDIQYEPNQGLLFVLSDMMKYLDEDKLKELLHNIWRKHPGAEVVFDAKNSVEKKKWNWELITKKRGGDFLRISVDNCTSLMYDWNIKYKVIVDEPMFTKDIAATLTASKKTKKYKHAINRKYDKIVQLRLGRERFLIDF